MVESIHSYSLSSIDGSQLQLKDFKGKKILLVNTASACGLTPQYAQLEELHKTHADKIQIIGLPCNDFGAQEPGSESEIQQFCELNYQVHFPLTKKVNILAEPIDPLYLYLTKKEKNGLMDSEVVWNFQKYLINEDGFLIKVFHPKIEVLSEEFLNEI